MNDPHTIIKELQVKLAKSNSESEILKQVVANLEAQHQQENKTYIRLIDGLTESVEKLRNDKIKVLDILNNLNFQSNNRLKSYVNQAIEILE